MKGAIRPWGEDLERALTGLSGEYALVLVGQGPLAYHPAAAADAQAALVRQARERWAGSFAFHLFSKDREFRWDHGVGAELSGAPDGEYDLAPAEWLIAPEAAPAFASASKLAVSVFARNGLPVDYKLEAVR